MVICEKCGRNNSEDSNFCEKCGASLTPFQPSRIRRPESEFVFSRSVLPSLILGLLLIMFGITYSFGSDFGRTIGRLGENFGETIGSWGENFGETIGTWGENVGRTFTEWSIGFGRYFGASILIIIGILIVTNQLKRGTAHRR